VFLAKILFENGQRPYKERPCSFIVSLQSQDQGEIVQTYRDVLMIRSKRFLENCQRALRERRCVGIASTKPIDGCQTVETAGQSSVVPAKLLCLRNSGLKFANRVRKLTLLKSLLARIICGFPTIGAGGGKFHLRRSRDGNCGHARQQEE
jgi:hypothetical protein